MLHASHSETCVGIDTDHGEIIAIDAVIGFSTVTDPSAWVVIVGSVTVPSMRGDGTRNDPGSHGPRAAVALPRAIR